MRIAALSPDGRTRGRVVSLLLLALTVLVTVAGPAAAHTSLASSDPSDGQVVTGTVETVTFGFTTAVDLLPGSVRVVGRDDVTVEASLSDDGAVVTATFDPPLGEGLHEVAWRILAADSHAREGTVALSVQAPTPPSPDPAAPDPAAPDPAAPDPAAPDDGGREQPVTPTDPVGPTSPDTDGSTQAAPADDAPSPPPPPTGREQTATTDATDVARVFESTADLARVVLYLGMMVAVGLTLFTAWPHHGATEGAPQLAGWVVAAATVAIAASVVEGFGHVGSIARSGLGGALDPPTWRAVLRTGFGVSLGVRVAGLGLVALAARRRRRLTLPSGGDRVMLVGAGLVVLSFQFVGHTATATPTAVVRAADAVHVLAAAVWVGGLVGLALLSRHGEREGRRTAVARFSVAATYAVLAVAVAGIALTASILPTPGALLSTPYGQVLVGKVGLVAVLGAVGGYNHLVVVPAVGDGDDTALDRLRRTVVAEVVLVVLVLVLTGLLVGLSPL